MLVPVPSVLLMISIRSPHARGDTEVTRLLGYGRAISIRSPHARGDRFRGLPPFTLKRFQSAPLMRGETRKCISFQSVQNISIRSPHARGDKMRFIAFIAYCDFNPLPSCEGRRLNSVKDLLRNDFNPLPSCEGRPFPCELLQNHFTISIRSPHARGDDKADETASLLSYDFNPLPSCEGRRSAFAALIGALNFNPLPSCEGRHQDFRSMPPPAAFQSAPLMRGETLTLQVYSHITIISIRSPHARGDARWKQGAQPRWNFNPLPSCEGRRQQRRIVHHCKEFQSAPLMRGETS